MRPFQQLIDLVLTHFRELYIALSELKAKVGLWVPKSQAFKRIKLVAGFTISRNCNASSQSKGVVIMGPQATGLPRKHQLLVSNPILLLKKMWMTKETSHKIPILSRFYYLNLPLNQCPLYWARPGMTTKLYLEDFLVGLFLLEPVPLSLFFGPLISSPGGDPILDLILDKVVDLQPVLPPGRLLLQDSLVVLSHELKTLRAGVSVGQVVFLPSLGFAILSSRKRKENKIKVGHDLWQQ